MRRYNPRALDVRLDGRTIADVLNLSVDEAAGAFGGGPGALTRRPAAPADVGLGYLRLGQPAPALSGGAAQRVRLAAALGVPGGRGVLTVLDEPTVGLHAADVARLLHVGLRLGEDGATHYWAGRGLAVLRADFRGSGAYGNHTDTLERTMEANDANARRETVWFSPGCLGQTTPRLFDYQPARQVAGTTEKEAL